MVQGRQLCGGAAGRSGGIHQAGGPRKGHELPRPAVKGKPDDPQVFRLLVRSAPKLYLAVHQVDRLQQVPHLPDSEGCCQVLIAVGSLQLWYRGRPSCLPVFQLCCHCADGSQQAASLQCCRRTSPVAGSKAWIACDGMARHARVQAETQAFQGDFKAAVATYQTVVAKTEGKDVDLVSGLADALVADGKPQQARHRGSSNQ